MRKQKYLDYITLTMSLELTTDGISVPEKYQDKDKVVVRTPFQVIDISNGFSQLITSDGIFPLVNKESYSETELENEGNANNPELYPDLISFKVYGSEAEKYKTEIQE